MKFSLSAVQCTVTHSYSKEIQMYNSNFPKYGAVLSKCYMTSLYYYILCYAEIDLRFCNTVKMVTGKPFGITKIGARRMSIITVGGHEVT